MIAGGHLSIRTVGDLAEKIHNVNKKNGGQRKTFLKEETMHYSNKKRLRHR
jgi:hypothetical protein